VIWRRRYISAERRSPGYFKRRKEGKNVSASGYKNNPKINKWSV